jgi:hypothetical protein
MDDCVAYLVSLKGNAYLASGRDMGDYSRVLSNSGARAGKISLPFSAERPIMKTGMPWARSKGEVMMLQQGYGRYCRVSRKGREFYIDSKRYMKTLSLSRRGVFPSPSSFGVSKQRPRRRIRAEKVSY